MTTDHPSLPEAPNAARDLAQVAEICAAGGHHLSLLGRPRTGKAAVAHYLTGILPDLTASQASEVTALRTAAGLTDAGPAPLTRPPLITPHHTCTVPAVIGGGRPIRPGAAALACHGVLYLPDAPEFSRAVLDTLRQPLEYGHVTVARADGTVTFPARFILLIAANPCPCRSAASCDCSPMASRRYLARLAGPLLDRIDVKAAIGGAAATAMDKLRTGTTAAAARVLAARERAAARLDGTGCQVNALIPASDLFTRWRPRPGALAAAEHAAALSQISDRAVAKITRVAWTIADLAGNDRPGRAECEQALSLYLGTAP
jgi:magnesium chelatase family protein